MAPSPREADPSSRLRAVDAVYGAVLRPGQYEELIDAVNAIFAQRDGDGGDVGAVAEQLAQLAPHMRNALRLFEIAQPERHRRLDDFLGNKPFVALATTRSGRVVRMNAAARAALGDLPTVTHLPLKADAHRHVRDFLAAASLASGRQPPLVVGGWHPTEDRSALFVFEIADLAWRDFSDIEAPRRPEGPLILVKSTQTQLSRQVWEQLEKAFDLTSAEADVVRGLACGSSLKEISRQRGRSLNTVKTQLMAALRKTGTRSQGQLLCIVTIFAHVLSPRTDERGSARPADRGTVSVHTVDLAEGTVGYVRLGARGGRPVFLLAPTNRPDFTSGIVAAFAERNLSVICPVRPGSWGCYRWPGWRPETAAPVYRALLDRLSLGRVTLAGLRTGAPYAVELARQAPGRFDHLVLIDTGAPLDAMAKFAAMPPWPRTLYTTARLLPDLLILPFRYTASDFFAGEEGQDRAIRAFYRDSPVDLALLAKSHLREAARRTLAYYLEYPDQVARDIAHWVRDWSPDLREVMERIPVRFVHGAANRSFLAADVEAFCRSSPVASARIVDGAGMLMIYERPDLMAEEFSMVGGEPVTTE